MDSQNQVCSDGRSLIVKHSVIIHGHKTSVSLEKAYWVAIKEIAREKDVTHTYLINVIDEARSHANLSSAIRLYCLAYYKANGQQRQAA